MRRGSCILHEGFRIGKACRGKMRKNLGQVVQRIGNDCVETRKLYTAGDFESRKGSEVRRGRCRVQVVLRSEKGSEVRQGR